ncbi:unnamed protein product [Rotaria sp. Silwood2]|nr:unnamed protein product [Rotaria sp. Silwood2]CAF4121287.1 unnamed protein product [Rotaria sp. Silwood2]
MSIYVTIMGCAQPSKSIMPSNHIPIERLYDNGGYPIMKTPPIIMITAPPTPSFVKSALKRTDPDEKRRTERHMFSRQKPLSTLKSVNFDEKVLVKARTPTPSKIWYEKSSSTMPMRLNPSNDDDEDDDYDYDDDEVLSDEEQKSNEQMGTESYIPRLGTPASLIRRNQANPFWHKTNTVGLMSSTDSTRNNESFPFNAQQHASQLNTNTRENPSASPGNRIKVRRRLPQFGPSQISPDSSNEHPQQPSTVLLPQSPRLLTAAPLRQSLRRPSVVLLRQTPRQPSAVLLPQASRQLSAIPLHQSSAQPTAVSAYLIPAQTSIGHPYQSPAQPRTVLSYQSSVQPRTILSYQSSVQPSSETVLVKQAIPNANSTLNQHQPTLTKSE